ncbi:hypothetical protein [Streptomyces sp. NBC_00624]|uniref:hypothetical protein n=1 Tax=Streptomyces sp. NBC_00624 TaxID=2975791 RepID=UPI0030E19F6D
MDEEPAAERVHGRLDAFDVRENLLAGVGGGVQVAYGVRGHGLALRICVLRWFRQPVCTMLPAGVRAVDYLRGRGLSR